MLSKMLYRALTRPQEDEEEQLEVYPQEEVMSEDMDDDLEDSSEEELDSLEEFPEDRSVSLPDERDALSGGLSEEESIHNPSIPSWMNKRGMRMAEGVETPEDRLAAILLKSPDTRAMDAYRSHIEQFPTRPEKQKGIGGALKNIGSILLGGTNFNNERKERPYNLAVQDWLGKGRALGTSAELENRQNANTRARDIGGVNLALRDRETKRKTEADKSRAKDREEDNKRLERQRQSGETNKIEDRKSRERIAGQRSRDTRERTEVIKNRPSGGADSVHVSPTEHKAARAEAAQSVVDAEPIYRDLFDEQGKIKPKDHKDEKMSILYDNFQRRIKAEADKIVNRTRKKAR